MLKGVGPKVADHLQQLGIFTLKDLVLHLPIRYEDRTSIKLINQLHLGERVQVEGRVVEACLSSSPRKILRVCLAQAHHTLTLRFFHFTENQRQIVSKIGQRLLCYGEVRWSQSGYEMIHPAFKPLNENQPVLLEQSLTPIYPIKKGLHQALVRKIILQALTKLEMTEQLSDYIPNIQLTGLQLPSFKEAIFFVHNPPLDALTNSLLQEVNPWQQRLAYEELLAHQLAMAQVRIKAKNALAPKIKQSTKFAHLFLQQLPYQLTSAQKSVIADIVNDLQKTEPMLRLVHGEVGSGKTVVAALAATYVIESGFQVAMMAPTELLAEQLHYHFKTWFQPFGIKTACLTSSIRGKARESTFAKINQHAVQLIVGTHALFQKEVIFAKLGLIIIDEQHRFGVGQRLALLSKGITHNRHPHQLIMSATPIPRTLAMLAYADLDLSTIKQLPPGRMPIETLVLPNNRRQALMTRVSHNCLLGAQAYWVCSLIQESEILQCQAAENVAKELSQLLPTLKIGLIHGKMAAREKEQIMLAFKSKDINLLVATTVIEVGVDVPNASLMIIENAERLGLAQLHQLRGRIGRGDKKSHCILLYQSPLSNLAKERLSVLKETNDGFLIAEKDLDLRGSGEVLGTRQTGLKQFKIADLPRDASLLMNITQAAQDLLVKHPETAKAIINRWIAHKEQFSDV